MPWKSPIAAHCVVSSSIERGAGNCLASVVLGIAILFLPSSILHSFREIVIAIIVMHKRILCRIYIVFPINKSDVPGSQSKKEEQKDATSLCPCV